MGKCRGLSSKGQEQGREGFSCCDTDTEVVKSGPHGGKIKIQTVGEPRTETRNKERARAEKQRPDDKGGGAEMGVRAK